MNEGEELPLEEQLRLAEERCWEIRRDRNREIDKLETRLKGLQEAVEIELKWRGELASTGLRQALEKSRDQV